MLIPAFFHALNIPDEIIYINNEVVTIFLQREGVLKFSWHCLEALTKNS